MDHSPPPRPTRGWTGDPQHWKLIKGDDQFDLRVRLPGPLGELDANQHETLRRVFGEAKFNFFSSFHRELLVSFWGDGSRAWKAEKALRAAGFDVELMVLPWYTIHHEEADGTHCALIIECRENHDACVKEMLEAGVPVEIAKARPSPKRRRR